VPTTTGTAAMVYEGCIIIKIKITETKINISFDKLILVVCFAVVTDLLA